VTSGSSPGAPADFSDEEMAVLMVLTAPIERSRGDAFLRAVAGALAASPVRGAGVAHRIGRVVQRDYFSPPRMDAAGETGEYSRSPWAKFGPSVDRRT
jgi:hypothetical protein